MQQDNSRTELGLIRIHKNAIASVSSLASLEIEGVSRIGLDFKSKVMGLIGKQSSSAIKVEISKSGEVKVEIPLFIKYGYNIPEVANRVQENARQALERMTNLSVKDIDVNVQGIERGML